MSEDRRRIHGKRTTGLRWWQRLVIYRALEVDDAGRLVWRNILVTVARQLGKSWMLRELILWRLHQGFRFDEPQQILHVAHKAIAALEVWRPAAHWAKRRDGFRVRWTNGEQQIELEEDGSRWMLQAATEGAGVSFSCTMILVDEAWRINRSVVDGALDPTLAEAVQPQLWLVSTAGDSQSDLFAHHRAGALERLDDPASTLILEWSAPRSSDPDDAQTWRLASPHWNERRESEIADKVTKASESEFRQQWLNQWVDLAGSRGQLVEEDLVEERAWDDRKGPRPDGPPLAVAIESWFGAGCSVAYAWEGHVVVHEAPSIQEAGRLARAAGTTQVLAGKSLVSEPGFEDFIPAVMTTKEAAQRLRRVFDEGLTHDGGAELSAQVKSAHVVMASDGIRVRPGRRMDAVKAAVWAVQAAREREEDPGIF